jgi:hypothetical protein
MINEYFSKSVIYIILFILFPAVFCYTGMKIANRKKYQGLLRIYFMMIISCTISLCFFYFYALLINVFDFNVEYLNFTCLIFIPISIILLILFSILFFLGKLKNRLGR